jgi:hypothetical protein
MQELKQINKSDYFDSILYNNEIYTFLNSGLTRNVFVNSDKTKVIKILIDNNSINHNEIEYKIFDLNNNQMAITEYDKINNIIIQEYVKPVDRELTLSEIKFSMACRGEVGLTKLDKLVCFDLDEYKKY